MGFHYKRIGFWDWTIIVSCILLDFALIYFKLYLLAINLTITAGLLLAISYVSKIEINKEKLPKFEKGKEFLKLRLQKYQTYSIILISLGFGLMISSIDDAFNQNQFTLLWLSLLMFIAGFLIETNQVKPRYKILGNYYSSLKIERKGNQRGN